MVFSKINDIVCGEWASEAQKKTAKKLNARIAALREKQNGLVAREQAGNETPLDTIIDWGTIQKERAMLLMDELPLRQDILTFLENDAKDYKKWREGLAGQFEAKKDEVLAALIGIGYTMESLLGCDILLRHPQVKELRLAMGSGGFGGAVPTDDAIRQIENELKGLRQRKMI
jgi:hypothetical protein